eukprot:TRINITY_DN19108_c0_g5_i1.p1 TRINITY_DN19108_c0_g5~~TRINITY_DN19108_c0_g5_i1.p1  ORF type:complete len:470 (+),score=72.48 TRINITY_DN19108_c0_g5_i1:62-1471(+)
MPQVDFDADGYRILEGARTFSKASAHSAVCRGIAEGESRLHYTRSLVAEVFPPFLLAGLGMVAAGQVLSEVRVWRVFREVDELLIMVPALLGLKGNLEMTLASRLSTHANCGHLDTWAVAKSILAGNLALVQLQAVVVAILASLVAMSMDLSTGGQFAGSHLMILTSSAVSAAGLASMLLSVMMILIVLASRRCGINPDNVASPIAGLLGDLVTLSLLAGIAEILWAARETDPWLQPTVIVLYCLFGVGCGVVAYRNEHIASVLRDGWVPVILSMLISSLAGLILRKASKMFQHFAPFAPVMNGSGGNLAAVQASRISTSLHQQKQGMSPTSASATAADAGILCWLCSGLCGKGEHAWTGRVIASLEIPGALCFIAVIVGYKTGWHCLPSPTFVLLYELAAILQVLFLVALAHVVVTFLWKRGIDPDSAAIPYITSCGDVAGTLYLALAFGVLDFVGGEPWYNANVARP